jgi:hypothetical protein
VTPASPAMRVASSCWNRPRCGSKSGGPPLSCLFSDDCSADENSSSLSNQGSAPAAAGLVDRQEGRSRQRDDVPGGCRDQLALSVAAVFQLLERAVDDERADEDDGDDQEQLPDRQGVAQDAQLEVSPRPTPVASVAKLSEIPNT